MFDDCVILHVSEAMLLSLASFASSLVFGSEDSVLFPRMRNSENMDCRKILSMAGKELKTFRAENTKRSPGKESKSHLNLKYNSTSLRETAAYPALTETISVKQGKKSQLKRSKTGRNVLVKVNPRTAGRLIVTLAARR